jgi:cobalamin biosynthesis protein CobT
MIEFLNCIKANQRQQPAFLLDDESNNNGKASHNNNGKLDKMDTDDSDSSGSDDSAESDDDDEKMQQSTANGHSTATTNDRDTNGHFHGNGRTTSQPSSNDVNADSKVFIWNERKRRPDVFEEERVQREREQSLKQLKSLGVVQGEMEEKVCTLFLRLYPFLLLL